MTIKVDLSSLLLIGLLVTVKAASASNCFQDGSSCTSSSECCNGYCSQNHCLENPNSRMHILTKRQMQNPSCEDIQPPCKPSEKCILEQVQCFVAPCYPVPTCVKTERPTCENIEPPCGSSEICILRQVQCITAPCYPIPTCVQRRQNLPSTTMRVFEKM